MRDQKNKCYALVSGNLNYCSIMYFCAAPWRSSKRWGSLGQADKCHQGESWGSTGNTSKKDGDGIGRQEAVEFVVALKSAHTNTFNSIYESANHLGAI